MLDNLLYVKKGGKKLKLRRQTEEIVVKSKGKKLVPEKS